MNHPSYPDLTFTVKRIPPQKSSGEYQYSLGNPPLPERRFIEAAFWKGFDITEFVNNHCDFLFDKWEEEIN